jgi:hypothetical protein
MHYINNTSRFYEYNFINMNKSILMHLCIIPNIHLYIFTFKVKKNLIENLAII